LPVSTQKWPRCVAATLALVVCSGLLAGCRANTPSAIPAHGTYAGMQKESDKYASLEVERLANGYFGTPLHPTAGAHAGTPVPIRSVRVDADLSHPLSSRLEPFVDWYTVPVLNSDDEILGEYLLRYSADPDLGTPGWRLADVNREGVLVRDIRAKGLLGPSPEAASTLVSFGTVWSIVASGTVERGVAPYVIYDHSDYATLPEEGRVYSGRELLKWFTPEARGW